MGKLDAADKALEKIPTFESFKRNEKSGILYVFLIMFFIQFVYTIFFKKDDCEGIEKVVSVQSEIIKDQGERIKVLEVALHIFYLSLCITK